MASHADECHEAWEWPSDDAFNLNASTAPPDVSCSLWDDFSRVHELDPDPCDSTPSGETRQSTLTISSTNAASEVKENNVASELDTRCFKRRRMLLFSDSDESVCDEALKNIVQTFQASKDPYEDFVKPDASLISTFWLDAEDHFLNPGEEEISPGLSDCWMDGCGIRGDCGDDELPVADNLNTRMTIAEMSAEILRPCSPSWDTQRVNHDLTQAPVTIDPRSPSCAIEGAMQTRIRFGARTSKLVYPFAVVKPCGVHGDATLQDINRQILMGASNSARSEPNVSASRQGHTARRTSSSSSPSSCDSPSDQLQLDETEPSCGQELRGQGSSFSGKSVVALTKIHTYGNGTITIRRTRG